MSRDCLTQVFFIKHLLLVSLDTPRKYFEFFRIFEELTKEPSGAKYSKESRLPCDWYTGESWLPGLLFTRKFFLLTCSYACSKYTKKSTPLCIHHRGVETPLCIHHWGDETPRYIPHRGVETRRCIYHWGVVLDTRGHFTDFKEHTTIFTGSIILKIVCRFL